MVTPFLLSTPVTICSPTFQFATADGEGLGVGEGDTAGLGEGAGLLAAGGLAAG